MCRLSVGWGLALLLAVGCSSKERGAPGAEALAQSGSPIVGGSPDTTTKGVVALTQHFDGEDYGFCSGSLLAPNLVLTARHCVSQILDEVDGGVDCDQTHFGGIYDYSDMSVSIQDDIRTGAAPS